MPVHRNKLEKNEKGRLSQYLLFGPVQHKPEYCNIHFDGERLLCFEKDKSQVGMYETLC